MGASGADDRNNNGRGGEAYVRTYLKASSPVSTSHTCTFPKASPETTFAVPEKKLCVRARVHKGRYY